MPLVRYALAAAAACLLGGVAVADTPPGPTDNGAPPPAAAPDQTAPDQSAPGPAAAPSDQPAASDQAAPMQNAPAAGATGSDTSAQVADNGTQAVASQPVPDTPANRAQYGQPLSHAGKHTAATGD